MKKLVRMCLAGVVMVGTGVADELQFSAVDMRPVNHDRTMQDIPEFGAPNTVLLFQDFEQQADDWTFSPLWHLTTGCLSSSGDHSTPTSFYFGLEDTCDFGEGETVHGYLDSPEVAVPAYQYTELRFKYLLGTEQVAGWDLASISVLHGGSSTVIDQDVTHGGSLIDDGAMWYFAIYDLSDFAGLQIRIRFEFDTIDGVDNQHPGFYVDDFLLWQLGPIVFVDGFESGDTTAWSAVVP